MNEKIKVHKNVIQKENEKRKASLEHRDGD